MKRLDNTASHETVWRKRDVRELFCTLPPPDVCIPFLVLLLSGRFWLLCHFLEP